MSGLRLEETLEERLIATSAESTGEPAVKPLWLGTGKVKGSQCADVMHREGVRACRKRGRDEGTEPRRQVHERRKRLPWKYLSIYAEKTSYFRNICAEIADFVFLQLVLLARSSQSSFAFLLHCQSLLA